MNKSSVCEYVAIELYNEPNRVTLHAIDICGEYQDAVKVFITADDLDYWLSKRREILKRYNIELEYNTDKPVRVKILDMYESAKVLKIENGEVWIG